MDEDPNPVTQLISGRSISCSARKRSATILSSSTEVPVIELPSSNSLASISPPGARHECVPRACFEIYLNLSIPLGGTAHNSSPAEGVEAAKYSNGPEMVNSPGSEPIAPGSRSMSRAVFAFVPSLLHISLPCTPSSALKRSTPLYAVNWSGSNQPYRG